MSEVQQIGEASVWIEQQTSIHLKAVSPQGDPIELTVEEARALASALLSLADELQSLDNHVQ
jgi:hypothetical protein